MSESRDLVDAASAAVLDACAIARRVQGGRDGIRAAMKADRSPVTVADLASQAAVAMALRERLGTVTIVGEETATLLRSDADGLATAVVEAVRLRRPGASLDDVLDAIDGCDHDGTADSFWALDPVDGTKGFLAGRQYAVSLALITDGVVRLGILGCPNLAPAAGRPFDDPDPRGTIFTAVRGDGAWARPADGRDGEPVRVRRRPLEASRPVRLCESVERTHSNLSRSARVMAAMGIETAPARLDSQTKYAVVARGEADVYLRMPTRATYVERIWDHAAGMVVAAEAGAIVTDIEGADLDFGHGPGLEANRGIVCADAGLHARLVETIAELGFATPA